MSQLNRVIGLRGLTLYGVGVTLGAGIYALVGEMAGLAGGWTPLAFLFAGVLAGLTGLSYAELGSRYPESAGEAAYVDQGMGRRSLTAMTGYGVALSGSVSSAVVLHGFAGYLGEIATIPDWIAILGALLVLTGITMWGVRESIWIAGTITVIEALGLLVIIIAGAPLALSAPPPAMLEAAIPWAGIFAASVMAFYAFIGFEDIANMAEEVKDAHRNLPRAILITLAVSAIVYVAVSLVAVKAVPPEVLAQEGGPLTAVFEASTGMSGDAIAWIALLAMVNGAMVQIIMTSRVLYGLARRGLGPKIFAQVDPHRKTPVIATAAAAAVIAMLALSSALGPLAIAASTITLLVFAMVNAALMAVRKRGDPLPEGGFKAPIWAPWLGLAASLAVAMGAIGAAF